MEDDRDCLQALAYHLELENRYFLENQQQEHLNGIESEKTNA